MIGDSPTTGALAARSAGLIPGTDRMVLIDTTGLDGAIRISSACSIACSTPGAGSAVSTPTWTNSSAGSPAR